MHLPAFHARRRWQPVVHVPVGRKRKRKASDIAWKVKAAQLKERGYDFDIRNPNGQDEEIEHTSAELLDMLGASFSRSSELSRQLREEF